LKNWLSKARDATTFLIHRDQDWIRRVASLYAGSDQRCRLVKIMDVPFEQDQSRYGFLTHPSAHLGRSFRARKPAYNHTAGHSFQVVHLVGRP
jgi:hypothetical protein